MEKYYQFFVSEDRLEDKEFILQQEKEALLILLKVILKEKNINIEFTNSWEAIPDGMTINVNGINKSMAGGKVFKIKAKY